MDYRDNRQRWTESHQVVHFYAGQWCTFTPGLTFRTLYAGVVNSQPSAIRSWHVSTFPALYGLQRFAARRPIPPRPDTTSTGGPHGRPSRSPNHWRKCSVRGCPLCTITGGFGDQDFFGSPRHRSLPVAVSRTSGSYVKRSIRAWRLMLPNRGIWNCRRAFRSSITRLRRRRTNQRTLGISVRSKTDQSASAAPATTSQSGWATTSAAVMRRPRIPWASSRACVSPVPFISSPGAPNEQNHQLAEPIGVERMGRSTPENDQLYSARTFATWRRVSTNAIWHSTRSPRRPRLSWSIRPRSRSRSPWSNSTPDFHVPRRQIDCQLSKLGDGEIGSVKKRDQFLLSWLAEDDPIGGKLPLQALKRFHLLRIG